MLFCDKYTRIGSESLRYAVRAKERIKHTIKKGDPRKDSGHRIQMDG